MNGRVIGPLLCLGLVGVSAAHAQSSSGTTTRHKPGPVDVRGVATHLNSHTFTLRTPHKGSYTVVTQAATQIGEKGQRGTVTLHEGDDVLVRGFLSGRTIRAIRIHIYPVKPKPFSIRGSVSAIFGARITVLSGGRPYRVMLTSQTSVVVATKTATAQQIHVGDRVLVRLVLSGGRLIALRVHVYQRRIAARHVRITGTVVSAGGGMLTVQSGTSRYHIGMTRSTVIHRGSSIVGPSALRPGETVTVYACCVGRPLQATSVHILRTVARTATVEIRGYLTSANGQSLHIKTSAGVVTVWLSGETLYEVGTHRVGRNGLRIGDQVTIRAARSGGRLIAMRIHVLTASRRPRTIAGVVVGVGGSTVTVQDSNGKRYVIAVTSRTSVSPYGASRRRASIHRGDRVRIRALPNGQGRYTAQTITVRPAKAGSVTVRGTIVTVNTGTLVIVDAAGKRHTIRVPPGVRPRLHGRPVSSLAVFPGAHVTVRGRQSGAIVIAASVTLSVQSRTVKGRLARARRATLSVAISGERTVRLDVPTGARVQDGSRRIDVGSLHVGAFIQAAGYVESVTATRAVTVTVEHPVVDAAAVLVNGGSAPTVQTTAGVRFALHIVAATHVVASRFHFPLAIADIPTGAHVHVQGTVDSAGAIVVSILTVRLESVSLRGLLASISGETAGLKSPGGLVELRLTRATTVTQGSRVLTPGDLVVGDDLTAEGYRLAGTAVLTRRLLVHRRLVGMDGTVGAVTGTGFALHTPQGDHQVVTTAATVISGSIAPGATVHVTGYLRGDGSILATRVRIGKRSTLLIGELRRLHL